MTGQPPFAAIPRHYITFSYLFGLFDHLKQTGVATAPVLCAMGVTEEDLSVGGDRLLSMDHANAGFDKAADISGDPLLGFRAGLGMKSTHLGLVGHMLMCSETTHELLNLLTRYGQLIGNGAECSYETAGPQVLLRQRLPPGREDTYCRHAHEYNLAGWLTLCRWMGGPDLAPDFIELPSDEVVDYGPVRVFAACDIRFGAPEIRLGFSEQFLQRAFRLGDTSLKPIVEAALRQRLQLLQSRQSELDPLVARVRQLIAEKMLYGTPSLQAVALAAQEPPRRLQYCLESRKTNFKKLVEEVRQEMADQHIRDESMTLVDVALMLGFSEQSAFQRAFKRWHGMRPGEYRTKVLGSTRVGDAA